MNMNVKIEKKEYLTVLSLLSCIAVVFLHVNGMFWSFSYSVTWFSANVIESLFYYAVPVFFMITGATLIDYRDRYSTKTYFKKRIIKVLIPYLIWSLGYITYNICVGSRGFSLSQIINDLLNGLGGYYFWFFIPLFAIYIIIPIISLIPKEKRKRCFEYIIIICFLTISVLPFIFKLIKINLPIDFALFSCSYILYVITGYYFDNYEINERKRGLIYLLGFVGLFIHIFGTFFMSYKNGVVDELFKGYLNFPCVLYSVAIFVFFKYFLKKHSINKKLSSIINVISTTTFGVYLIQQIVIVIGGKIFDIQSLIYRTLGAVIIFLICVLIIKIIQKIPVIKYIVPK